VFDYAVEELLPGEIQDAIRLVRKDYGWTITARLRGRKRLILDFIIRK
jgi:hypothetical protein